MRDICDHCENHEGRGSRLISVEVNRSPVFRPRACPVSLTSGLCLERLLEVFGINTALARRILIYLCLSARNCEGNVSLRRQFRLINRLRIQVQSGARLGMSKQALNCLNANASEVAGITGSQTFVEIFGANISLDKSLIGPPLWRSLGVSKWQY